MSALSQENSALMKAVVNPRTIRIGNQDFTLGKLAAIDVVIAVSGMGKVNAAMTAQKLISEFKVTKIVFSGVAGAVSPALAVGDVLLANATFQSDFGFLGTEWKVHRPGHLPEIGLGDPDASLFFDLKNPSLSFHELFKSLKDLTLARVPVNGGLHQPRFTQGVVATGDQFIANKAKKLELRNLGADVVEMEGASVAQVCEAAIIPLVLLRCVSDHAEDASEIDFQSFFTVVADNGSHLVQHVLRFCALRQP